MSLMDPSLAWPVRAPAAEAAGAPLTAGNTVERTARDERRRSSRKEPSPSPEVLFAR
jgi:hypothetical protein